MVRVKGNEGGSKVTILYSTHLRTAITDISLDVPIS